MAPYIAVSIISYFIGSISFAVIFSKIYAGFDVRDKGSKGAGTTNVLRSVGKKAAIITLVCDVLKGIVSVGIAWIVGAIWQEAAEDIYLLKLLACFFAILGHTFPIFFEFRGGKGVATAIGALLLLNWQIALICLTFTLIIVIFTRMVSLGSVLSATLFPILNVFWPTTGREAKSFGAIVVGILIALLVIFNHRANLNRIKEGTENKLDLKNAKN